jgi:hypothetical protein
MNTINPINNQNINSVGKLASAYPTKQMGASASGLKGALETQEMIQQGLSKMMRDVTPHLGQNVDVRA